MRCKVINWRTCESEPHELKDELVSSHIRLVCSKGIETLFDVFIFFSLELRIYSFLYSMLTCKF